MYAFSRDGGMPLSRYWRKVSYGAPTNSVWLAVLLAFILGLPMLNSYTAFAAITSISASIVPRLPGGSREVASLSLLWQRTQLWCQQAAVASWLACFRKHDRS